jgi:hypothetical protein
MNDRAEIQYRHDQNIERFKALEMGQAALLRKQEHLDVCVDGLKEKLGKWDRRFLALIWLAVGMSIMSGSGFVSLQHLIDVLKMVK